MVSKSWALSLQEGGGGGLLAQRGDAADHVAGAAFGDLRVAHGGVLPAEGSGGSLNVQLARDRHDCDGEILLVHDQQGLEHLLLGGAEVLRGLFTEGGDALNMLVFAHLEGGVRLGQQCYGGGCCAALLTF